MTAKKAHAVAHHKKVKKSARKLVAFRQHWQKLRSFRWFVRWPIYIVFIYLIIAGLSWTVDELLPKAKDPEFGVSFSIEYA
ncbi:MAG TPA: hypothetical protein VMT23_00745, partial [Candidatus Binatia bacterium]|nr:hypothetical protein [Candidatus Binatia bacterium]